MSSKCVGVTEHYQLMENLNCDRYQYTVMPLGSDVGEALVVMLMPEGWKPTPLTLARIKDTMLGVMDGRDLDTVPVGEVFGLVTTVAADIIRQLAQAKAVSNKAQCDLVEAQQKLLVESRESDAVVQALIHALHASVLEYSEATQTKFDVVERTVSFVRDTIDARVSKPMGVATLVKEIREVCKSWPK